jgi:hypothetical protein
MGLKTIAGYHQKTIQQNLIIPKNGAAGIYSQTFSEDPLAKNASLPTVIRFSIYET